ncbi:MAG: hypothetical protein AAFQ37_01430 [Bacteroidota bacterium]
MNRLFFVLLSVALLSLISCEKDDAVVPIDDKQRQITTQAGWDTEPFKENDLTIQFPDNYEGDGAIGFEGLVFNKNREDGRILMAYFYCSAIYCDPFGDDILPADLPAELPLVNPLLNTQGPIVFDEHYTYRNGETIVAHLYLRACEPGLIIDPVIEDGAYARLYLPNEDGLFMEALDIVFDYAALEEVLNIVGTIQ